MRKLLVLFALVLSTTAAWAQAEKPQPVTKLPGEENLSTRERAERDFLMPVRRKKAADLARPTASAEQLASAAPETDYSARYHEAPADPRPEEVAAPARYEATATRLAARREERAAEARRAARHTSKARRSSHSKTTKASRAKATRAARHGKATPHSAAKAATHKASKSRASTKKTVRHAATPKAKVKTKAKATPARHKHRR